jgi:hypothetical protein
MSYMRSTVDQNVVIWQMTVLANIFVFCVLFFVKNECSSCFSYPLNLLYTPLPVFRKSLQPNKFWHQKHIPLFVMREVPVSHKDGDYTGLHSGPCSTLLKICGQNKRQVQHQERCTIL